MVAEANTDAQSFYRRHGLTVERRVDGNRHYRETMSIETAKTVPEAPALILRYAKRAASSEAGRRSVREQR